MVCCCISCKAGPCSQGLPCQGPAELGEAVQTSLAVTSPRSCPLPWSFPWHRHTCWGGQWCLLPRPCSPGPVPTPGAHEVPAATFSHSCCPCQHGTVAWPPVRAPRRWAQPPVLQQGTQLRGYPSPQSQGHGWAPPGLFLSMGQQPRGVVAHSAGHRTPGQPLWLRELLQWGGSRSGLCWHPAAPSPHSPLHSGIDPSPRTVPDNK